MLADPPGAAYTTERIERLLKLWFELEALAESPATARGLLRARPTPEEPKVGARTKSHPGDPMRWCDTRADIERAWKALPRGEGASPHMVIAGRMQGLSFGHIALIARTRKTVVLETYRAALKSMMETLEGIQEEAATDTKKEPGEDSCFPGLSYQTVGSS
jgi:hypothetical protein